MDRSLPTPRQAAQCLHREHEREREKRVATLAAEGILVRLRYHMYVMLLLPNETLWL